MNAEKRSVTDLETSRKTTCIFFCSFHFYLWFYKLICILQQECLQSFFSPVQARQPHLFLTEAPHPGHCMHKFYMQYPRFKYLMGLAHASQPTLKKIAQICWTDDRPANIFNYNIIIIYIIRKKIILNSVILSHVFFYQFYIISGYLFIL